MLRRHNIEAEGSRHSECLKTLWALFHSAQRTSHTTYTLRRPVMGEFLEFPRTAWAVGSYSSGPPAGGTPQNLVDKTSRMTGCLRVYIIGSYLILYSGGGHVHLGLLLHNTYVSYQTTFSTIFYAPTYLTKVRCL